MIRRERKVQIIPVMDLKNGLVVHARYGQRKKYRPVCTSLCPDPEPHRVLAAFLQVYPFRRVYIADLDAISGGTNHFGLVAGLRLAFPQIEFWLDAGSAGLQFTAAGVRPVIGTEAGITGEGLYRLQGRRPDLILSLDFRATRLLGDPGVLLSPECWPDDIIVMCLRRVGSRTGPGLETAKPLMDSAPGRRIYLAGGVRNPADLEVVRDHAIEGVLLATALHDRSIDGGTIASLD